MAKDLRLSIIKKVSRDGYELENLSDELKADKDIALAAVKSAGLALEFCSESLRDDKDVVMVAIGSNMTAIDYASDRLKGDKSFFLEIIRQGDSLITSVALSYASKSIKNDPDILSIVKADEDEREAKAFAAANEFEDQTPYHTYKTRDGHFIEVYVSDSGACMVANFFNKSLGGVTKMMAWEYDADTPSKREMERSR